MKLRVLTPALVLASTLALAACSSDGADREIKSSVRTTTTGQELIDLKKAYDTGTITQLEYEVQRKKILERE